VAVIMKVHKVTLFVLDFDELGWNGVKQTLENTKYPNHCISPEVLDIESKEIGEWEDESFFNSKHLSLEEFNNEFNKL
jgi:hypothetical protein